MRHHVFLFLKKRFALPLAQFPYSLFNRAVSGRAYMRGKILARKRVLKIKKTNPWRQVERVQVNGIRTVFPRIEFEGRLHVFHSGHVILTEPDFGVG